MKLSLSSEDFSSLRPERFEFTKGDTMELRFSATILQNGNMDAAYVEVPYDIKELFGKGRLLVNAAFDGVPYRGQVVKMGTPCYIIGVTK